MTPTGATRVFGLVGRPIAHSLSPELHNGWFRAHGVDGVYVPFEVPEGRRPDVPRLVLDLGLAGVNLTVPFKEVADRLDAVCEVGRLTGAVNVVVREGGSLRGCNTDAPGFLAAWRQGLGALPDRVAVLGAGGAALAVAAALASAGTRSILLLNRTPSRAERAVARLSAAWPRVEWAWGPLADYRRHAGGLDAVVDATAGREASTHAPPDLLPRDAAWCDLDYRAPPSPGLLAAQQRGLRILGGLPMLVHQAALAFEAFTGILPDASSEIERLGRSRP